MWTDWTTATSATCANRAKSNLYCISNKQYDNLIDLFGYVSCNVTGLSYQNYHHIFKSIWNDCFSANSWWVLFLKLGKSIRMDYLFKITCNLSCYPGLWSLFAKGGQKDTLCLSYFGSGVIVSLSEALWSSLELQCLLETLYDKSNSEFLLELFIHFCWRPLFLLNRIMFVMVDYSMVISRPLTIIWYHGLCQPIRSCLPDTECVAVLISNAMCNGITYSLRPIKLHWANFFFYSLIWLRS